MGSKPQSFATTSAFEILGPVMVGPSSSSYGGALRYARVAATLIEGPHQGGALHALEQLLPTPTADTERTGRSWPERSGSTPTTSASPTPSRSRTPQGLAYGFDIAGDDPSIHPNTVDIHLVSDTGLRRTCAARASEAAACASAPSTACTSRSRACTPPCSSRTKTRPARSPPSHGALAHASMNIAFCRTYRTEAGGRAYSVFETDGAPATGVLDAVRALDLVDYATLIEMPGAATSLGARAPPCPTCSTTPSSS